MSIYDYYRKPKLFVTNQKIDKNPETLPPVLSSLFPFYSIFFSQPRRGMLYILSTLKLGD